MEGVSCQSLFVVLRPRGIGTALGGTAGPCVLGVALYYARSQGWLVEAAPWLTAALALGLVFGIGNLNGQSFQFIGIYTTQNDFVR